MGAASPFRVHRLARRHLFTGATALRGPLGWMRAAWIPAPAGTTVIFALYPVLFEHAFGVPPGSSSLAFAVLVLVSLPPPMAARTLSSYPAHFPRQVAATIERYLRRLGAFLGPGQCRQCRWR